MLALLLNIPNTDEDWLTWGKHHANDHIEIIEAIAKQKGVNLAQYVLYPIDLSDPGFLERHQQTHLDMDNALGVQSANLQDVDLSDEKQKIAWAYANYQEHFDARSELAI